MFSIQRSLMRAIILGTLGLLVSLASLASVTSVAAERIRSVAGIDEYRLDNGLTVLLFPDAAQARLTVNITYRVGSRHENYGETGMAHLLEHMLFKGSPKYPKPDEEFTRRGAQRNAITRPDITNYFAIMPPGEDNLRFAIALEADRMVNAFLRKEDLASEMTVVRNEYEIGENQPLQVAVKRLYAVAYDWHNYGKPPIGNRADIENVDIERLRAFYRTWYQPDNAVLLIAGRFDPAQALALVQEHFGPIPRPTRRLPVFPTVEPTQDGERSVVVRRQGDIQATLVGYRIPAALHPDSAALTFAALVLGHVPSGRLHRQLVEQDKLAVGAGAQLLGTHDPELFIFLALQKAGEDANRLRDALVRAAESFADTPPTDEEMARSRQLIENLYDSVLANPQQLALMLSASIAVGDWRIFFAGRDTAAKVTSADVARVARTYFLRDNRTVAQFLPESAPKRAEIPTAPTAEAVLRDWVPKVAVAEGEAFEASAANIDRRTQIVQVGGIKVALLPKKTRGQTVQVRIRLRVGDEASLTGRADRFERAFGSVGLGSTRFTRAQIADELQRRKMRGGLTSFETTRDALAGALELVMHVLREPTFPKEEIETVRRQALAGLDLARSDPGARVSERIGQLFNAYPPGHPKRARTIEEERAGMERLDAAELAQVWRDLVGASDALVVVVGDFEPEQVIAALRKGWGDWASPVAYRRIPARLAQPTPVDEWIDTPDKENAVIEARVAFALKRDDPDYPALWVANQILGGGGFESRLQARIREREGLSYSVGSTFDVGIHEAVASWGFRATMAPAAVNRVERAAREEIALALEKGFRAEEVERVKKGIRAEYDKSYGSDAAVASMWLDRLDRGLTMAQYEAFIARVQAVTPEAAHAALRNYIDPSRLVVIKGGDRRKAEAR
jgi:zinc protease